MVGCPRFTSVLWTLIWARNTLGDLLSALGLTISQQQQFLLNRGAKPAKLLRPARAFYGFVFFTLTVMTLVYGPYCHNDMFHVEHFSGFWPALQSLRQWLPERINSYALVLA
jgi:hypothetical protein